MERRSRQSKRQLGLVLIYHQVGPGSGDPRCDLVPQLDLGIFEAQLAYLLRRYELVPLSELLSRVTEAERGDRLPVALTFDDDLQTHAQYVAPVLEDAEIPATFFLTGASLCGYGSYWWRDLQRAADRGGREWAQLVREIGQTAASASRGTGLHALARAIETMPPEKHDRVRDRIRAAAGDTHADGQLTPGEIERIAASFEIGFHTAGHYNLQTLTDGYLKDALTDGLPQLRTVAGSRVTSIAYPHGRADRRIAMAAKEAGFELGFVSSGGPIRGGDDPLLLDRIDAWSTSIERFTRTLARAAAGG